MADIDPSCADAKPFAFAARRPELYGVLRAPIDSVPAAAMYGAVDAAVAPRPMRAAIAQVSWYHNDDWTLGRAQLQISYAARRGAHVAVLPELFCFRRGTVEADPTGAALRSDHVLAVLRQAALESRVHVIASLVARSNRGLHHRAVLIGDDGALVGVYDKTHLSDTESTWATPGDRFTVCDARIGRVGLMIGDEVWIPEVARCLALLGAEVIAHPCDWDRWQARDLAATERTEENRVHLLSCARTDNIARIGSQATIADRFQPGQPIALMRYPTALTTRTGFEEQLVVDLDLNDAHSKMMGWHLDPLATRTPHLYGPMTDASSTGQPDRVGVPARQVV